MAVRADSQKESDAIMKTLMGARECVSIKGKPTDGKFLRFHAVRADYEMSQHRWAQLFLIRKDPNVASINRHRMLVFEDEILKRRDSVLEARVDRLLTDLGLLEEEIKIKLFY
jgi:hypothetical protein